MPVLRPLLIAIHLIISVEIASAVATAMVA